MKTRVISAALALMLILTMMPVTALAANETYSVDGMNSVPTISISNSGGYALKNDGSLWTWAYDWAMNAEKDFVGTGSAAASDYLPRNTNSGFIHVVSNYGLKANGELWAWGYALEGNSSVSNAVKVADNIAMIVEQRSYPIYCTALTNDGKLVQWSGVQQADGKWTEPVFSKQPEVLLTDVISYDANEQVWRALKSDGTLWYRNFAGTVTKEMDNVAAFSTSDDNATTLAIKTDGALWAWGDNTYGQVGNGGKYTSSEPQNQDYGPYYYQDTPVKVLDDVIYAEAGNSSFAITSDGTLYGWGSNGSNQLGFAGGNHVLDRGYMQTTCQNAPKASTTNVVAVATSSGTTLVLKRDGTLWSCGGNFNGVAGLSTITYPDKVEALTKIMDDVALPEGRATTHTPSVPTPTPAPVPTPTIPVNSTVIKDPNATAQVSNNANRNNYGNSPRCIFSNLFQRDDGLYVRVEYSYDEIHVEVYSQQFELLSTSKVPKELSAFGGVYWGEDYNYIVFGAANPKESDDVEVARIVMYTKDWVRVNHASFYGSNTYSPFHAGSLRCTEYNGMIFVLTGKTMYKASDGLHHQANMGFYASISELAAGSSPVTAAEQSFQYVSHSFNQFIFADSMGNILTLNHGDGHPRAAILTRDRGILATEYFPDGTDFSWLKGDYIYVGDEPIHVYKFQGDIGDNNTGASIGGVAESSTNYIVAGNSVVQDSSFATRKTRNIFLTLTDKTAFTEASTKTIWLTNHAEGGPVGSTSTPHLVKINDNRFLVLWHEYPPATGNTIEYELIRFDYDIKYVFIDGDGVKQGEIHSAKGALSDCPPILSDGKVVWYATEESVPTFFAIDATTGAFQAVSTEPVKFSDVADGHWAATYISRAAQNNLVQGVGDGKFEPERNITNAEMATLAVNLFYKNDTGRSGDYWWSANMDIAGSKRNILAGTTVAANGTSSWNAGSVQSGINRYDMAQVIYNIAKEQGWTIPDTSSTSSKIADWSSIPTNYREAVAYCFSAGFVTGVDSNGTFNGASTMTRAQAATVLCRLLDAKNAHN